MCALCALLSVFSVSALAASDYTFDASTGELVVYTDAGQTAWMGIVDPADVKSITIKSDVSVIKGNVFQDLVNLEELFFEGEIKIEPETIEEAGGTTTYQPFSDTAKLATITFGGKVDIGPGVFNYTGRGDNTELKELVFPAGSTFGASVFCGCNALESITFEGDATITSGGCFSNLPELKSLVFKGESNITSGAFWDTTKLESITFGGKTNIGSGVLYYPSSPNTALKELVFPEDSTFGSVVFSYCNALESVTFEGDVTLTGSAFANLLELKNLVFKGESILSSNVFAGTTKLETISFGGKTEIGYGIFAYSTSAPNTALKKLVLPEGSTIGSGVFSYCNALESVTFEGDIQLTSGGCFMGLSALKSIDFKGESVLASGAFMNCLAIESITFGGKTEVRGGIFYYSETQPNTGIKELVFPEGSVFPQSCFSYLYGLEKLVFEGDVDITEGGCFYKLPGLKSVEFKGTSKIGQSTFNGCGKLKTIVFADAVELGTEGLAGVGSELEGRMDPIIIPSGSTIGDNAFADAKISSVEFMDAVPPTFGTEVFVGCPEDAIIYVPEESLDAYIEALAADATAGVPNPDNLPIKKAIKRTTITVVKEWDVPEGTYIPASITAILYADGAKYGEAILNADNNWSYTFTNVPVTTKEYVDIVYTVDELETPEDYKKAIGEAVTTTEGTKFVITNKLIVIEVESSNSKFYDDNGQEITSAEVGTTVTIKAEEAPAGKVFDKWVVVSGDVTLVDPTKAETTFVMTDGKVSIVATYKDAPADEPGDEPSDETNDVPSDEDAPDSGDKANAFVWMTLLVIGCAIMGYLFYDKKRRVE